MEKIYEKCPYNEGNCNFENCACAKYKAYEAVSDPEKVKNKLNELGFDINTNTWELMMKMQKMFASKFHKVEGFTKEEKDFWLDKYLICVEDEIREVREHLVVYPEDLDVKEKDTQNIELKKEIIDILHFIMDEFICGDATPQIIEKYYLKLFAPNTIAVDDFFNFAYNNQIDKVICDYEIYNKDISVLLLVNKLLDCSGTVRQCISWKHWKKASETIDMDKLYEAFATTFKTLIDIFAYLDMEPEEVKDIYIKKNIENCFRQQFGYLK